jgi:hypothetical protein
MGGSLQKHRLCLEAWGNMGRAAWAGDPTAMRRTLQVRALPREQTYSWNEGMFLRCH